MKESDNIQKNEDMPKKEEISLSIENKEKTEESIINIHKYFSKFKN